MFDEPFYSVIIPIYNVEKFLNQCVDSVLSQSFSDYEVILVDDGSSDKCPIICDEYAKKNQCIKVIHKRNEGLSAARNSGIDVAKGKYLLFLDSDDYWDDSDALKKLYYVISQNEYADLVMFQAKLLYPDGSMITDKGQYADDFNYMNKEEALKYLTENGLLVGSACSKVVRREFLLKNNLFFKVGIKSEDIDWILRVANCMPKYLYSDQFFYIYRKGRSDSITANMDYTYLEQFADMLEEFYTKFDYISEETKQCLLSIVAYEFSILMAKVANLKNKKERVLLTNRLKKMQIILDYDMHPKVKQINSVKHIAGFNIVMMLLGIYLKYRKR